MSEAEFDRLLDAVRTAVAPIPEEDFMSVGLPIFNAPLKAANDNGAAWPLVPFPDGGMRLADRNPGYPYQL